MKISVIIPTKNRCDFLAEELELLSKQTLSQDFFEVIVIDNGSTDQTKAVCDNACNKFTHFVYIHDDVPGLHTGRNRGFQASRTDLLVFIDDDIIMPPTWLESILYGFEHTDAVLIGGNCIPEFAHTPPQWLNELWWTDDKRNVRILSCYSCIDFSIGGSERNISPFDVYGCNFAVRKSIIAACQGFIPDYVMSGPYFPYQGDGETNIARYIEAHGLTTRYLEGASVRHRVPEERLKQDYVLKVSLRNGAGRMHALLRDKGAGSALKRISKDFLLLFRDIPRLHGLWRKKRYYVFWGKVRMFFAYLCHKNVRSWIHQPNYLGTNGIVPFDRKSK